MFASLSNCLGLSSVAGGSLRPASVCVAVAALAFCAAGCSLRPTNVQREGGRVWIDDVPRGKGEGNGYIRGLETLLAHAGTPTSYERLMGLSGLAFITQADTEHRWQGKLDAGWWPLDPWGLELRREFLARATGHEIANVGWPSMEPAVKDTKPPEFYRTHIHAHVKRSIEAGRPVVGIWCDFGFVITGYDGAADRPPVWGRCARSSTSRQDRCSDWPAGLFMLGRRIEPMDRDAADAAAVRHAVALAHDQAGPTDPRWRHRRFTGQKAYAAWAALLRNVDEPTEDMHHANVKRRLLDNRRAAVAYLRSVAERREGQAAEELHRATASYGEVLKLAGQIKPKGLSGNPEARRNLADLVDRIAAAELEAAKHLERAATHMAAGTTH